jgi:hypothetical protein
LTIDNFFVGLRPEAPKEIPMRMMLRHGNSRTRSLARTVEAGFPAATQSPALARQRSGPSIDI